MSLKLHKRPLGVASLEDKIVQHAVVTVLNAIYESDFVGISYGFRPGRNQHDALDAVAVAIEKRKINWVVDADFRKFFDTIDPHWLQRFVAHRIGDQRLLRLIDKWLTAGVMEDGQATQPERGTPQGSVSTPLTQKVTLTARLVLGPIGGCRATISRGSGRNGDAMADSDGVVADQDLLDHEPYDSLALKDIERVCSGA